MFRKIALISLLNIILTAGFICPNVQAQEQSSSQVNSSQESPAEPAAQVQAPAPAIRLVTAIEVKGNKSISTNTIISKMKTKIGSPYQENVVSDDLKRLYLLGFFSDININTEDYKDGIKVVVTVKERPIIEKITFSGLMHLMTKEEKIKEALKSKELQYLDYPNLAEDVRILSKMYEKIGYNKAQITYTVDLNKETNRAKVQFNVVEGKKVRIKTIKVEGNTTFPSRRIIRLMKTRNAWFFNAGLLKEDVLKEDIERVKSFYNREGFSDASVDYEIKSNLRKPYLLTLIIKIKEGKRYLVGNVVITGNKEVSEKEILARLKFCIPGKVFSQDSLKEDMANIQGLYFDKGYISAQVQETTALNTYTGRIDITYDVTENTIAYVAKVKIRGNVKTKDVVIRRELRIKPGDRFDGDKLRRSKERLQNLGFFEEVSYDTQDTSVPDRKDLIVDVKESKTGAFSFGGGYSTIDQFVGFVEIEQKNFDWRNFPYFTGAGQDLKLRASFGSVSSGYELSFTEPWVFDYPVSFGFDAYKREHSRDTDLGYGYDENVVGGDFRLGKQFSEYITGNWMYGYDSIKISNVSDNATADLKQEIGTNGISHMNLGLTYDSRDNIFDTTKGDLLTATIEDAGGFLGGNKDYWKFYSRASHYIPLMRGSALELRGRVGVSAPYGDSHFIPIYERFFAGGANTIRGYRERRIGPIDPVSQDPLGGNALLVANIEYVYPLFSFLKVAAFCDAGNVWDKIGNMGFNGIKTGAGLGVRIKTPIGPVMLDYGIPFNKEPGEADRGDGRFHFNISQGF